MAEQQAYRQIVKATSLFGGVQFINIVITIIRSKVVAVLLGPAGMGINALLQSSITLVGQFTNFGLSTSAVKDIAQAQATGNEEEIAKTVAVFRKWAWLTGGLGFMLALLLAPVLSRFAFGNSDYTISFLLIAVTLLLGQISAGQGVVLRGLRKLNYMASSSVLGAIIGLLTSLPLYYFFGQKGIVPAIIITSVTGLLLTWYFSSKVSVKKTAVTNEEVWQRGKSMLQLGFMLSLNSLITAGAAYLLRIYISKNGSIEDVGLFNAGFSIINTYVGLVFTAMSTDYYPRLAAAAHNKAEWESAIWKQAEIAFLILGPLLALFIVCAPWAVVLLYSKDFLAITPLIIWAALGILFKAASWAIAFIFLAKGATRLFFFNELAVNIYMLALNIVGYEWMGLKGLGISFIVIYVIYFVQVGILAQKKYQFTINRSSLSLLIIQLAFLITNFIIMLNNNYHTAKAAIPILIFFQIIFSAYTLNQKLDIIAITKRIKK